MHPPDIVFSPLYILLRILATIWCVRISRILTIINLMSRSVTKTSEIWQFKTVINVIRQHWMKANRVVRLLLTVKFIKHYISIGKDTLSVSYFYLVLTLTWLHSSLGAELNSTNNGNLDYSPVLHYICFTWFLHDSLSAMAWKLMEPLSSLYSCWTRGNVFGQPWN